ncbi:MAG: PQQ-dependent sugar dehydrogenase [Sporichthyaceae bacterium]
MRFGFRPRFSAALLALTVVVTLFIVPATPAQAAVSVGWRQVASGLGRAVQVTSPRDGTGRLFVVGLGGRIRIVENGSVRSRPYLNISDRVLNGFVEGLLSIAFHPQWKHHPFFWAAYINAWGNLQVTRFQASSYLSNHVEAATGVRVLTVRMPDVTPSHYGGQLAFGNDGTLYLSTGDGGGNGDPGNGAQDKASLRGKILRFRVVGAWPTCGGVYCVPPGNPFAGNTPGNGLIWALGLRNPWRFSVDSRTGNLWIGDVGEHRYEEVNRITAGAGGENLGWSCREGNLIYNASRCRSGTQYRGPRFAYGRDVGTSITGGFVYRGQRYRALLGGHYIAGDFISGRIFHWFEGRRYTAGQLAKVSSFGEGDNRELYAVTIGGGLFRMTARTS